MDFIPRTVFSTEPIAENDRFDLFRDSMSVIFDVELDKKHAPRSFTAEVEAFMFDQVMLAKTESIAAGYNRRRTDIGADGIDMIMIQLYVKGEELVRCGQDITHVKTGDIIVYDLNKEALSQTSDFINLSVIFPRDMIESYIPTVSHWHNKVLPRERPMTQLLKNHILSLYQVGPKITNESCAGLQRSLLELTSSALQHSADILPKHKESVSGAVLLEIKKWIQQNLSNPELSLNSICGAFGTSRAQLYRITEPLGGLMNYVRDQRLKRALYDLKDPTLNRLSVTEIGFRWGFNDAGTFTRNFKRQFGFLPKEAREQQNLNASILNKDRSQKSELGYDDWVRSLAL